MPAIDSFMRSSMNNQIEEARRRAYPYAQPLSGVRQQDISRAKSFDEEHDRWARTFEEKSVLIEQLERELQSAVEALDLQRLQNVRRSSSTIILDDDKINSDIKKMIHSQSPTRSPNRRPVDTSRMSATSRSFATDFYQNGSFRMIQPHLLNSDAAFNTSALQHNGVNVWNHLLEQYKEQLQSTRDEVTMLTQEKKELIQRLLTITKELTLVADERDQMKHAMIDMEGKLQFRSAQVREYELERKSLLDVDRSKALSMERLQNEVNSLKFQVQSMERENKVSLQTIASLQQDIQRNSLDLSHIRFPDDLREKDQEIFRLQQQLNEKDRSIRQELAETKQLVRSLQLRLANAESLNQVSHLEQRYDRTLDSTEIFRRGLATPIASPSLSRSNSHHRLHEIDTISSSLKRVSSRDDLRSLSPSSSQLKRSSSRDKLSSSPSQDNLFIPTRSPNRNGSDLKLTANSGKGLAKSPSKSKLVASKPIHNNDHHFHHSLSQSQSNALTTIGAPSPRRSNSAVNFRDEQEVHVFSTEDVSFEKKLPRHQSHLSPRASPNAHHHISSESEGSRSANRDDSDEEIEEGVYEVESADDIFRSMDDQDLRQSKSSKISSKSSSKKSSSGHKGVTSSTRAAIAPPGITVTISPKKKVVSSSSAIGGRSSVSAPSGSASPTLKSALKGKALHVLDKSTHPVAHTQHIQAHHPADYSPMYRDPHSTSANRLTQSVERDASRTPDNQSRSNSRDSHSANGVRRSVPDTQTLHSVAGHKSASKSNPSSRMISSISLDARPCHESATSSKLQQKHIVTGNSSSPSRTSSRVSSLPPVETQFMEPEEDSHSIISLSSSPSSSSSSSLMSSSSSSSSSSYSLKHKKSKKKKNNTSSSRPIATKATDKSSTTKIPDTGTIHKKKHKSTGSENRDKVDKPKKLSKKMSSRPTSSAEVLRRSSSFASLQSQYLDEIAERGRSPRHRRSAGSTSPILSAVATTGSRSRSASAHSRVSSSNLSPLPESKPFMRPTSSFMGKIITLNNQSEDITPFIVSGSPVRSPSQRDLWHSQSLDGTSNSRDARKSVVVKEHEPHNQPQYALLGKLTSASSSFRLPTSSSRSKSAFAGNMHLSGI